MTLTVAIPTYNRSDKVKATLERLLPQLTPEVKVMVLDNHSDVVIKNELEQYFGQAALRQVEVVRNRVNIGADSNFQRCFELCITPYLWMLGDDDRIEPNAVQLILSELEKYKHLDLIGINFNSDCNAASRNEPVIISSTSELANKLDSFGNWLFISTSVYKTEEYLKHVRYQAWGAYSMASQLVPPMVAISKGKSFVLSEKYIVTNLEADTGDAWSDFQLALSQLTILEAPVGFSKGEHIKLGRSISIGFAPIGTVFLSILKSTGQNIRLIDDYHLYIYKQYYRRTIPFKTNKAFEFSKYRAGLFFLRNKALLRLLISVTPSFKKRIDGTHSFYLFERKR